MSNVSRPELSPTSKLLKRLQEDPEIICCPFNVSNSPAFGIENCCIFLHIAHKSLELTDPGNLEAFAQQVLAELPFLRIPPRYSTISGVNNLPLPVYCYEELTLARPPLPIEFRDEQQVFIQASLPGFTQEEAMIRVKRTTEAIFYPDQLFAEEARHRQSRAFNALLHIQQELPVNRVRGPEPKRGFWGRLFGR